MTREEAIAELNVLHERLSNPKDCEDGCYSWEDGWYVEAVDMAIEALSADAVHKPDYSYEAGMVRRLKEALSADRPTGEWVTLERDENVYDIYGVPTWGVNYMCDKCGFITTAIQDHFGQYKFCPNCGAKMGGDDE